MILEELVFVLTHRRSRRVVSEVVVGCEVNPKHGLPHVLYFRAVDCLPPPPPAAMLHASHSLLNPSPPTLSLWCICFFLFRLSVCSVLISTYLGRISSHIQDMYPLILLSNMAATEGV